MKSNIWKAPGKVAKCLPRGFVKVPEFDFVVWLKEDATGPKVLRLCSQRFLSLYPLRWDEGIAHLNTESDELSIF